MAMATITPNTLNPAQSQREVRKEVKLVCVDRDCLAKPDPASREGDKGDMGDKSGGGDRVGFIGISFDMVLGRRW